MEDAEIVLMFSFLMIPAAIWLQLWVKARREKRKMRLAKKNSLILEWRCFLFF